MPKYRKKPVVIEAHQWFKNGDHPEDGQVDGVGGDPGGNGIPHHYTREGDVVRYFRDPGIPGHHKCAYCGKEYDVHGWIDTVQGGHAVCPGDWIIEERGEIKKGFYPCKPDVFKATYEKVT